MIKAGWGIDDFENLDDLTLREKYPNILNFYVEPPGCDIRLETMETLAMERLRFLRIIEKYSRYVLTNYISIVDEITFISMTL